MDRAIVIRDLNPVHLLRLEDLHSKPVGLAGDSLRQFRTAHTFRESRKILNRPRPTRLTAKTAFFDHERFDSFPRRVNRGSQAGGSTANDDEIVELALGLRSQPELLRQSSIRRLDQELTILEHNGGND